MRQRPVSAAGPPFRDRVRAVLEDVRDRTLALVAPTPEPALVVQHSPSTSPVVRDLGHMAAFEDLWSAVFLGSDDYRVLGGGSWAPRPAVARCTFRNRDDPIRRRIFAGLRLARGGTAG